MATCPDPNALPPVCNDCGFRHAPAAKVAEAHREKARELLDADGYEPTVWAIASALAEAEEGAVYDFLQWLAAQNITLHRLVGRDLNNELTFRGEQDGVLWERWKTERTSG